jgi:AraC family transcriptional regulator
MDWITRLNEAVAYIEKNLAGSVDFKKAIQVLEKRIVTEWLPSSGYEYDNGPDVEVYLTPDPKQAKYEVWIPVIKKQGV